MGVCVYAKPFKGLDSFETRSSAGDDLEIVVKRLSLKPNDPLNLSGSRFTKIARSHIVPV